jgi:hypothetical protein
VGTGPPSLRQALLGLRVDRPAPGGPARAGRWDYDCTPTGAITFASTGTDGGHFSALDGGVIVMTVPMQWADPNHVLGESLGEFLALGCRAGYAGLEQLAYQRAKTTEVLQYNPPRDDSSLDGIIATFSLRPWPDVAGRLDELATTHLGRVRERR